jgi:hypothetical protein
MQTDDIVRTDTGAAEQGISDHYKGKVAELTRDLEVCRQALLHVERLREASDEAYYDQVEIAINKAEAALDRIGRG